MSDADNTERHHRVDPERETDRQSSQAAMQEKALRQPGIREIMRVYYYWQSAEEGLNAYRAATKEPMIITTANHANQT